ncbi:hypothetical protein DFH06DRAFT_57773 [Mycena polygramma]|nr:hypothetical protein DFH06DRAFT_57773 [Mycena polygramma]
MPDRALSRYHFLRLFQSVGFFIRRFERDAATSIPRNGVSVLRGMEGTHNAVKSVAHVNEHLLTHHYLTGVPVLWHVAGNGRPGPHDSVDVNETVHDGHAHIPTDNLSSGPSKIGKSSSSRRIRSPSESILLYPALRFIYHREMSIFRSPAKELRQREPNVELSSIIRPRIAMSAHRARNRQAQVAAAFVYQHDDTSRPRRRLL